MPSERVFDVHVHAVAGTRSQAAVVADLARLAGLGYEEALLIAAPGFGLDAEGFRGLYPDFARAGASGGRQDFDEAVSLSVRTRRSRCGYSCRPLAFSCSCSGAS